MRPSFGTSLRWTSTFFAILAVLASCLGSPADPQLVHVYEVLGKRTTDDSGTHALYLQQLVELSDSDTERDEAIRILSAYHGGEGEKAYGALASFLLAELYEKREDLALAKIYYQRTLRWTRDVMVRGESVQYMAARRLYQLESDPGPRVEMARLLLDRFPEKLDMPRFNYELGFLYEKTGDFAASRRHFAAFLQDPGSSGVSQSSTVDDIRRRLALYSLDRTWSRKSLNDLVSRVKQSIRNKDVGTVNSLKTRNGFFSMSWLQERSDFNSVIDFNIDRFIFNSSSIIFENDLEAFSNSQEAFLKSRGWSVQMPVWYLYFRKIDFPADPYFHNTWEWAGVYFGDTLQDIEANRGL